MAYLFCFVLFSLSSPLLTFQLCVHVSHLYILVTKSLQFVSFQDWKIDCHTVSASVPAQLAPVLEAWFEQSVMSLESIVKEPAYLLAARKHRKRGKAW